MRHSHFACYSRCGLVKGMNVASRIAQSLVVRLTRKGAFSLGDLDKTLPPPRRERMVKHATAHSIFLRSGSGSTLTIRAAALTTSGHQPTA
jgi:hypothetical protein